MDINDINGSVSIKPPFLYHHPPSSRQHREAQRCNNRRFVDKSHKTQPLPSPHCAASPRMASLPKAPWSGRDLASASRTAQIHTKRSKREMQLSGILATTSLVAARRPCVHTAAPSASVSRSLLAHLLGCQDLNGAQMLPVPVSVRASPCFYCLRWRERGASFPSADLQWNSRVQSCRLHEATEQVYLSVRSQSDSISKSTEEFLHEFNANHFYS